jgi:anti-anti-sigma factor
MSITTDQDPDGKLTTIRIHDNFDFDVHRQFRNAYCDAPGRGKTFVVDLLEAPTMDSSALGMLLLLREHAGGDGADVRIVNCNDETRNILKVASFDGLFRIG